MEILALWRVQVEGGGERKRKSKGISRGGREGSNEKKKF